MNRGRWIRVLGVAVLGAALDPTPIDAQTSAASPVIYRLDAARSTYQDGCFDPCLCPMLIQERIRGTWSLTASGFDGLFTNYKVTDVNWTVPLGDPGIRVTGSGTYRIGGEFALQQQLVLDLKVDDRSVQRFDSGLVGVTARFPEIDVSISINGAYCRDTVLTLSLAPVPREEIRPYRLLATSTFERGCFDPCDCPSPEPQPIAGTFALVPTDRGPLFREFGVVDVRWLVRDPTAPSAAGTPVAGSGSYRIGGQVASEHRLILDLRVGSQDTARFDSGQVVGGGNFPRIDIPISIGGRHCFDTVIDVHAAPRWTRLNTLPGPR